MANCNGWFGTVKEGGWLAAYIPPFAVRLQRMGHPSYFGWIRESGSRLRANAHISKSRYGAPNFVASIQKWATRLIRKKQVPARCGMTRKKQRQKQNQMRGFFALLRMTT
jgi:hypothetical protein